MSNKITKEENSFLTNLTHFTKLLEDGRSRKGAVPGLHLSKRKNFKGTVGGGGGHHGGVFHIPLPTLFKVCLTVF